MAQREWETAPKAGFSSGGIARLFTLALSWFLVQVVLGTAPALAQWKTQDIQLRPGWNVVYLAVQPEPDDPESVFGNLPVESVWSWNRRFSSVQFVQDAAALIPGQPDWLTYLPPESDLAFLGNLFAIRSGRAYLIKLGGGQAVTWQVTGKVVVRPIDWVPDSFNLVGFSVDASSPPSFASFFAPSPAHAGSPIYRLSEAGEWVQIDPSEAIAPGEAYWVYCEGSSSFPGPLRVTLEQAGSLDFGRVLTEQVLRVQNETDVSQQLVLRPSNSTTPPSPSLPPLAGAVPLLYWDGSSLAWTELPPSLSLSLAPREQLALRLAVRRREMVASTDGALYQSILDLHSDAGTRHAIPVVARGPGATSDPRAGLWVGVASIDQVSWAADPTAANRTDPTATASEMQIRLIVHVDGSGQARLLQHVTLMWRQGTQMLDPDGSGNLVVDEPGRFVLVADDGLLELPSPFWGAAVRDGQQVGRRISSAAFGFQDPVEMDGAFGGILASGPITLDYDDPLNPFLHKFHPDHDNLDYDFQPLPPERSEAYEVVRNLALEFKDTDPDGLSLPAFGDSQVGGDYRETFTGLHKETIYVAGKFRLHQVSRVTVLDDGF